MYIYIYTSPSQCTLRDAPSLYTSRKEGAIITYNKIK